MSRGNSSKNADFGLLRYARNDEKKEIPAFAGMTCQKEMSGQAGEDKLGIAAASSRPRNDIKKALRLLRESPFEKEIPDQVGGDKSGSRSLRPLRGLAMARKGNPRSEAGVTC